MKLIKVIKQLFLWLLAICVACIICNILMFLYHRPVGWIDRDSGATLHIWNPDTTIIHGIEGRGVYHVDRNGYLNEDKELDDNYILAVGSSYTQGKEVKNGLRYTDILNDMISTNDSKLAVYNCSQDGYTFEDIVSCFKAITQEFEGANAIIIEIYSIEYSDDRMLASLQQRDFDETQIGCNIIKTLSSRKKINMKVKEWSPLLSLLKYKYQLLQGCHASNNDDDENSVTMSNDATVNGRALDEVLRLIRSEFNGDIIICYHPNLNIGDSELSMSNKLEALFRFERACEQNGIIFVDMTETFQEAYKNDYFVPNGFNNTAMGVGHFNEAGHRMTAEKLYQVIKENGIR